MSAKTDEFKSFVKTHPGLKKVIYEDHKTWQNVFEEWSLLGPDDASWLQYQDGYTQKETKGLDSEPASTSKGPIKDTNMGEIIKTCVNYIKKIDTDSVTKTVNNVQKLMTLVAGLGAANTVGAANKLTGDPLFDKRFDEWY